MGYTLRSGAFTKTKSKMKHLIVAAIVAATAISGAVPLLGSRDALAAPTTIFVRTDGDNSCDGSIDAAYDSSAPSTACAKATIENAVVTADPYTTVTVTAGTYNLSGVLEINKPLTLMGQTDANVIGQILVTSSEVTIDGLTISVTGAGPTVKAIQVFGATAISEITISNNTIKNVSNTTGGSYGIMIQRNVSNVEIYGNVISNISSTSGWASGIEITPSASGMEVPQNIFITDNTISDVTAALGGYVLTIDAAGATTADASEVQVTGNVLNGKVRNLDLAHPLVATDNYWGQQTGPGAGQVSGTVTVSSWCEQSTCASTRTTNEVTPAPATQQPTTAQPAVATAAPAPISSTTTTAGGTTAASTVSTTNAPASEESAVLGTSTDKNEVTKKAAAATPKKQDAKQNSNFLGLGWWWLLVVGALGILGYYFGVIRHVENA
jgi:hypothetical protein